MSQAERIDDKSSMDLVKSKELRDYLSSISKWTKFISICGMLIAVLEFLFGIITPIGGFGAPAMFRIAGIFMVLLFASIIFLPYLFLFKFSIKLQVALKSEDETALTKSFRNLKFHYVFLGVFIFIIPVIIMVPIISYFVVRSGYFL